MWHMACRGMAHEDQKRMSDPLELESQTFVNFLIRDLDSSPLVKL